VRGVKAEGADFIGVLTLQNAPAIALFGTTITFDADGRLWHCENMKNITVSVDSETYRLARIKAAERDTSVSALVKQFLVGLAADQGEFERLAKDEEALRLRIQQFRAADRLARDDLHARRR
jgi:hypothetical protein